MDVRTETEILPSVHLVGSGRLGFGLTDAYDCHVYLVAAGDDAVVIDAGCGRAPERVLQRIARAQDGASRVRCVLLTHGHADHAGGAAALARELGAEVWAPDGWADALERGDEEAVGLVGARAAGIYPLDYRLAPCPVDRRIGPGPIEVGALRFEALATPGHCRDHLSFLAEIDGRRVAFAGDLVFADGRVVLPAAPDGDGDALAESLDALAARDPDVLLAGHGELVLEHARGHIEAAQRSLAAGAPRSLLP